MKIQVKKKQKLLILLLAFSMKNYKKNKLVFLQKKNLLTLFVNQYELNIHQKVIYFLKKLHCHN